MREDLKGNATMDEVKLVVWKRSCRCWPWPGKVVHRLLTSNKALRCQLWGRSLFESFLSSARRVVEERKEVSKCEVWSVFVGYGGRSSKKKRKFDLETISDGFALSATVALLSRLHLQPLGFVSS